MAGPASFGWKQRSAPAVIAAILAIVATYASMRGYEVLFLPPPSFATAAASAKIAMFSRLEVGAFIALWVAVATYSLTGWWFDRVLRVVAHAVPLVALLIAVQGLFLP